MESGREGRSEKGKKSRSDGGPKEQKLFLNGRSEADLSLGIGTRPGSQGGDGAGKESDFEKRRAGTFARGRRVIKVHMRTCALSGNGIWHGQP